MKINIKDILTLDDDNRYIVISKINYEERNYYYLMDVNVNSNIKFCYEEDDELIEIDDNKFITKLLPLFYKEVRDKVDLNKLKNFNQ